MGRAMRANSGHIVRRLEDGGSIVKIEVILIFGSLAEMFVVNDRACTEYNNPSPVLWR